MAPGLVLFDIDGTLLRRAGPHHREALEEAVFRVSGLAAGIDGIPVQGMLDRDIITVMLRRSGATLKQARAMLPEIMKRAQSLYARRCPDLTDKTCPGAREALERLRSNGLVLGLVTGNLSRIGWKKMERAGLKRHFRFGAFAEQAKSRSGLARLAIREARRNGWIGRGAPVALVGDHPNDVEAAKRNRIRSIAVTTGLSSAEELAARQPDYLLAGIHEVQAEMVLGRPARGPY